MVITELCKEILLDFDTNPHKNLTTVFLAYTSQKFHIYPFTASQVILVAWRQNWQEIAYIEKVRVLLNLLPLNVSF